MENNCFLKAQEALDVSVLLKNVTNDTSIKLVVNLFNQTRKEHQMLQGCLDFIWHDKRVQFECDREKNKESLAKLKELENYLADLLASHAKDGELISQLIGDEVIDIKYLLYEMPSDLCIDFVNNYLKQIDDILMHFEFQKGSSNDDYGEKREKSKKKLLNLSDQLIAIRDFEVNTEKEWQKKVNEALAQESLERDECFSELHSITV